MRMTLSTMAWAVGLSALGTMFYSGCINDGSICTHFANDPDPICHSLQLTCPDGVLKWGQSNLLTVLPQLSSLEDPQATLIFSDHQQPVDQSLLSISDRNLMLTLMSPSGTATQQRGGPVQVKLTLGDSNGYSGSTASGACLVTVPVTFAASPDVKVDYANLAMPATQDFALQYGGPASTQPGAPGRLYVTELLPAVNRQLERWVVSDDHTQLRRDATWKAVRDKVAGSNLATMAANSAGLLLYDGGTPTTLDLSTVLASSVTFRPNWAVPGTPPAGKSVAAAQDLSRFLIADALQIVAFTYDGLSVQTLPPVTPIQPVATGLTGIVGTTLRTAVRSSESASLLQQPAEVAAWSPTAVEIFDFYMPNNTPPMPSNVYLRNDGLSQAASTRLAEILPTGFSTVKLALADLDDDGLQDLIALEPSQGVVQWARQQAAFGAAPAGFSSFATTTVTATQAIALTAGDLDGNGLVDLAVATYNPVTKTGQVQVFFRR